MLSKHVPLGLSVRRNSTLLALDKKWTRIWEEEKGPVEKGSGPGPMGPRPLGPRPLGPGSMGPGPIGPRSQHLSPSTPSTPSDFYCLAMFPYPSGRLHMGHVRNYTITDVIARFRRLQGYRVIHPMGWDAFGLPAENAARDHGIDPAEWTYANIDAMKHQLDGINFHFDWHRELRTCDPKYYKWTQDLFLLMYRQNLAYKKEAVINWDPVDGTVLANEQVDAAGKSWRSGAVVEKRRLSQWFLAITDYADRLHRDLDSLPRWPDKVKTMQRNWIGRSQGVEIDFVVGTLGPLDVALDVALEVALDVALDVATSTVSIFTTRPETLGSVEFMALALSHPLVEAAAESDSELASFVARYRDALSDDTATPPGFRLNLTATPPIEGDGARTIPVFAAPYVVDYAAGAVMGCPRYDSRDNAFWRVHGGGKGALAPPAEPTDIGTVPPTIPPTTPGAVRGKTSFRLRDWLISRQRSWGVPIPIVYCHDCGPQPVPHHDLPVTLDQVLEPTSCPSCGGPATRESDTMDTFMDLSWYFFRYLDPNNDTEPFSRAAAALMPVDIYVGGVEHAILHLLYARFVAKVLGDAGLWGLDLGPRDLDPGPLFEPIDQLITQGMVQAKTYRHPSTGECLAPADINPDGTVCGDADRRPALVSYEKMSKSKNNGVDPGDCVAQYGADAVRAHMMFSAPVDDDLLWNEDLIVGVQRWLKRVLSLAGQVRDVVGPGPGPGLSGTGSGPNSGSSGSSGSSGPRSPGSLDLLNTTSTFITSITTSVTTDLSFNTVVSDLMKWTNAVAATVKQGPNPDLAWSYRSLLIMMSPIAPAVAEESWEIVNSGTAPGSVLDQPIPEPRFIVALEIKYNVFVNGKMRRVIEAPRDLITNEATVLDKVFQYDEIKKVVTREELKKVIMKEGMISLVGRK